MDWSFLASLDLGFGENFGKTDYFDKLIDMVCAVGRTHQRFRGKKLMERAGTINVGTLGIIQPEYRLIYQQIQSRYV